MQKTEHVIAGYMRPVGKTVIVYTRDNMASEQDIHARVKYTLCQDISDSLGEAARLDAVLIDFSKSFDRVPPDRLLKKFAASGVDLRVVPRIRDFFLGHSKRVRLRANVTGSYSDVRRNPRECFGPTFIPSLRKRYLEKHLIQNQTFRR
jgi:hypothetical protein